MKPLEKKRWRLTAASLVLTVIFFLAAGNEAAARGGNAFPAPSRGNTPVLSPGDPDLSRILSVLGKKENDLSILAKTKEKLLTMSRKDIHLISTLCDRMEKNSGDAGEEVAFLLITALIVTS